MILATSAESRPLPPLIRSTRLEPDGRPGAHAVALIELYHGPQSGRPHAARAAIRRRPPPFVIARHHIRMGAYARLACGAISHVHRHSGKLKSPTAYANAGAWRDTPHLGPTWGADHGAEVYTAKQWRRSHEAESGVSCDM